MSGDDRLTSGELNERIAAFQKERFGDMPPEMQEIFATFRSTTEEMVRSGIAERSVHAGDRAPDFALPGVRGETVRLSEVLAGGPAILAFYRGVW